LSQEAYHGQTRVLVGEDQGIIPLNLQSVLEANGYEITFVAMSGDDALSYVEEVLPDVGPARHQTRRYVGWAPDRARIRKRHDQITLVYITSYSQQNIRELAAETNPSGYLIKPITKDALLEAVAEAIED
jgi:CheY-like chemotaxis protein|tara:strand:- start:190 stop:579 length:390 start_codon:yes stop_codon:yes gene_type:complete